MDDPHTEAETQGKIGIINQAPFKTNMDDYQEDAPTVERQSDDPAGDL